MQVRALPRAIYRGARESSRLAANERSEEAKRRDDKVRRWRQAQRDGLGVAAAARAIGVALSTLYRWENALEPKSKRPHNVRQPRRDPALVAAIERLRKQYPMWGRDKLAPLLRRQGFAVSVSTVGRILRALIARGVLTCVPSLRKRVRHGGRRHKRPYATRLPKHTKPQRPGHIVQLDTVHIGLLPGKTIRHFTAYCPIAKWTVGKAYNRATAASASLFLDKLTADMPFKVEAIQVDGGSEFMAEFESECARRAIKLYELPPRSPELNGGVERCNGAWRYEFYACTDLPGSVEQLNPLIEEFQDTYNFIRPHGALSGLTPAEYYLARQAKEAPVSSQMS